VCVCVCVWVKTERGVSLRRIARDFQKRPSDSKRDLLTRKETAWLWNKLRSRRKWRGGHGVATISRLLKVYVSFAEYRLFYRALLQKRPTIWRSLLIVATPCHSTMGWLRFVGSLKLKVSFAKEPYKRDNILQKRPVILRSLLIVATSYHSIRLLKIIGLFCKI